MSVRLRQRGRMWYLDIHDQGQRTQRSTGTSDQRKAEKIRRAVEAELAGRSRSFSEEPNSELFEVFAEDWLDRQERRVRSGTLAGYKQAVRVASKLLAGKPLGDMKRMDARRVVETFARGRERKTARNLLNVLHALFADALDQERVDANPFRDQKRLIEGAMGPARRSEKSWSRRPNSYTKGEQEGILAAARESDARFERQPGVRNDHLAILIGLRAGLRRSEVLALQRGDIDFERRIIRVRRRISRHMVGDVKSEASSRDVPMSTRLELDLRAHLQRRDAYVGDAGEATENQPLFPAERRGADGTGSTGERNLARRMRQYVANAGAPDR